VIADRCSPRGCEIATTGDAAFGASVVLWLVACPHPLAESTVTRVTMTAWIVRRGLAIQLIREMAAIASQSVRSRTRTSRALPLGRSSVGLAVGRGLSRDRYPPNAGLTLGLPSLWGVRGCGLIGVWLVVVVAAGCSGRTAAVATSSPTAASSLSAPRTPASSARAARRVQTTVSFARLYSRSFGVAVVSRCTTGVTESCVSKLVRSGDLGRTWHDITPSRITRDTSIDAVFFLDARRGWVTAGQCWAGTEWLYRTGDGGDTWRRTAAASQTCNAGATVAPDFVDSRDGWLEHVEPTAPFATLERTSDGGRTWVAARRLPNLGAVEFQNADQGWLGGGGFGSGSLFVTHGAGRVWRRTRPAISATTIGTGVAYDLPTFFGPRGVLPATDARNHRANVVFATTTDGGATWSPRSRSPLSRIPDQDGSPYPPVAPTSIVSPTTWWVLAGIPLTAYVTADSGRSWSAHQAALPRPTQSISAINARVAWVGTFGGSLYRTIDGGGHWMRVVPGVATARGAEG
jgi:photosystem II stability/assembly factor-like uncharacterized protein